MVFDEKYLQFNALVHIDTHILTYPHTHTHIPTHTYSHTQTFKSEGNIFITRQLSCRKKTMRFL